VQKKKVKMNSLLSPFEDGKTQGMQITNTLKRRHSMYNPMIKMIQEERKQEEKVQAILARNGSSKTSSRTKPAY